MTNYLILPFSELNGLVNVREILVCVTAEIPPVLESSNAGLAFTALSPGRKAGANGD